MHLKTHLQMHLKMHLKMHKLTAMVQDDFDVRETHRARQDCVKMEPCFDWSQYWSHI